MDFFEAQARARSRSLMIIGLAVVALIIIIVLVYFAGLGCWYLVRFDRLIHALMGSLGPPSRGWWHPGLFVFTTSIVCLVVGCGCYVKLRDLHAGGNAIANSLRARLVRYDTNEMEERQLINIIEELSLASGVRIPEVFILDEDGINSFCAGHAIDNAVVIVTQGAVDMLTRDEMQAMLAHEFSHILNGDMRTNTFLVGVLHGFFVFSIHGWSLVYLRSPFLVVTGLASLAIGWLGRLLGTAIQAMLCRQQEWMADAHAVQFTRNPQAIVNVMMKIGGNSYGSLTLRPHAIEAAHMFFANPLSTRWFFRSHPPLASRIRKINPRFDGYFPRIQSPKFIPLPPDIVHRDVIKYRKRVGRARELAKIHEKTGVTAVAVAAEAVMAESERGVKSYFSHAVHEGFNAASLAESIPGALSEAAHDKDRAPAVFLGLLFHHDLPESDDVVVSQIQLVASALSSEKWAMFEQMRPQLASLPAGVQLALADLTLPALRQLEPEPMALFLRTVDALVMADFRLNLQEFALRHMVRRCLRPESVQSVRRHIHLNSLSRPIGYLLGALAHAGHPRSGEAALQAFRAGAATLPSFVGGKIMCPSADTMSAPGMMEALRELDAAIPWLKKKALSAFARTIEYDGILTAAEAELLRIITAALNCPAPPLDVFERSGVD